MECVSGVKCVLRRGKLLVESSIGQCEKKRKQVLPKINRISSGEN